MPTDHTGVCVYLYCNYIVTLSESKRLIKVNHHILFAWRALWDRTDTQSMWKQIAVRKAFLWDSLNFSSCAWWLNAPSTYHLQLFKFRTTLYHCSPYLIGHYSTESYRQYYTFDHSVYSCIMWTGIQEFFQRYRFDGIMWRMFLFWGNGLISYSSTASCWKSQVKAYRKWKETGWQLMTTKQNDNRPNPSLLSVCQGRYSGPGIFLLKGNTFILAW